MRNAIAAAFTASTLLAGVPAGAQALSSTAYKATQDYAACLVREKPADARALIDTVPESREAKAAETRLAKGSACPKGDSKASGLRGVVAERVYLDSFAAAPVAPAGPVTPFAFSGDLSLVDYDITRCTATRDPVDADALVRAELKSDGEKAALKALMPTLGSCVAKGGKIGFDRERMRGLLAEGLLRVRGTGAN
jgi:hypothetical protein